MGKLDGKVAVISGAGGGIGKYLAIRYAEEGANVALCDIHNDLLIDVAQQCEQKDVKVYYAACDVSKEEQVDLFISKTVEQLGTVDILVNLAVVIELPHSFMEHTVETLYKSFETGLLSTWLMMRKCYPYMKENGGGKVINFGSASAVNGYYGYSAYASTKEGIRGLSRVVAREWAPDNINVNIINPGALTDKMKDYIKTLPEEKQDPSTIGMNKPPNGRYGDAYQDIAPVAVFLASEDSRHMTGQTFNVDGGVVMRP